MEPSPTPMKEKQKLPEREMCPWAISKYFGDWVPIQVDLC
jgi:hypothetical protein